MISLEKIVTSNLEMLKSQEEELLKSLSFVQKAKQLFRKQWGSPTRTKKRGRPAGSKAKPAVKGVSRKRKVKAKSRKGKTRTKRVSHLTNIINVIKHKNTPITSGELIQTLFRQQKSDRNLKHYRLLIYPVLTKAYKTGTLKLKNGKISLPASSN